MKLHPDQAPRDFMVSRAKKHKVRQPLLPSWPFFWSVVSSFSLCFVLMVRLDLSARCSPTAFFCPEPSHRSSARLVLRLLNLNLTSV